MEQLKQLLGGSAAAPTSINGVEHIQRCAGLDPGPVHLALCSIEPAPRPYAPDVLVSCLCRADGGFELSLRSRGPEAVHFTRGRPFAAILPSDAVAGQVLSTGINQFL